MTQGLQTVDSNVSHVEVPVPLADSACVHEGASVGITEPNMNRVRQSL